MAPPAQLSQSSKPVAALVTGGAGFIGHHLVRALCERGDAVRVIDDCSRGDARRLEPVLGQIDFRQASILDEGALAAALEGIEVVYHQAAWAGVPQSVKLPMEYHENNATGTLRLLEAAQKAGVRRFVYAASSSAYGEQAEMPKRESMRPLPISPYAAAKYAGELYVAMYAQLFGMQTVRLRYFNVFGPGQDPQSQYGAAIPAIVMSLLRGKSPVIFGDGEQTRDFCFVENVVRANLLAADAPKLNGEVVNVACGQRISLNRIVALANEMLGTSIPPTYAPPRAGDVRDSWADVSAAKALLGYEPAVFFEEGLRRSIEWYRRVANG